MASRAVAHGSHCVKPAGTQIRPSLSPCSFTQLRVNTLPSTTATALARMTGLCSLSLEAGDLPKAVVVSALAHSRLTSLVLRPTDGLLPEQPLAELPRLLPLLANLELSEGGGVGDALDRLQLPAPADFPHLRTFDYNFEVGRRRTIQVRRCAAIASRDMLGMWRVCWLTPPCAAAGRSLWRVAEWGMSSRGQPDAAGQTPGHVMHSKQQWLSLSG